MKNIILIAAVAKNRVIGLNNQLPWSLLEDLKHFKQTTLGSTVVMGRNTWESLPEQHRPLCDRTNVVITSNPAYVADGALVWSSIESAIKLAPTPDVYIIGGQALYHSTIDTIATKLIITNVLDVFDGDTYFPYIDPDNWEEVSQTEPQQSKSGIYYTFSEYVKR